MAQESKKVGKSECSGSLSYYSYSGYVYAILCEAQNWLTFH